MPKLVMFCNDYPNSGGDSAFIGNEIRGLAENFDEIVVFHMKSKSATTLELPSEVCRVYTLNAPRRVWLKQFLRARNTRAIAGLIRAEHRSIGSVRQLVAVLRAIVIGRVVAGNADVQRELSSPGTAAYFYWGQGAAFSLPWIQGLQVDGRTVVRMHRYDLYDEVGYQPLQRTIIEAADDVLLISNHGLTYLGSKYPEHQSKMHLSMLGSQDRGLGVDSAPSIATFVSCSNLIPVKRVETIAQAMCTLASAHPVKWIHFGDGVSRAEVEAVIADAPGELDAQLMGARTNDQVLEYLRTHAITAFVNSSLSEGIPVSLMEALSFDIPIVAPDVGGVREMYPEEEYPGVLTATNQTASELAHDLNMLISQPLPRGVPRSVWSQRFNADANATRTARILLGDDNQ